MTNERLAVAQARRLIEGLPLTDETGVARARALSAIDDLWDDLVLAEKPSGPPAGVIMAAIGGAL